ncbi:MAG: energy transducer TonB, partial [Alphaproteobacteria bacterium]|nr:energy transducer TonB [Alphaproteobacteria bacterium]
EKPKPVEKIKPPDKKLLKPAPPKPQAKAEPKKEPEKDFQSLLKNLAPDAKEKTLETPDAVETASGEQAQMVPLGPRVTMSEMDAVKQRLSACWIYNIGGKNAEDIVVSVRVVFNPDTTVQQATIMDQTQYTLNPQYRAAADAAVRALRNPKCSPLPLPREKYNQWQTTVINFDPREMLQ